jgi:hypothetical protein
MTNSLPRCVNAIRITLVPKIENLACLNDYRSISFYNVMYKCIFKILANRLKAALSEIISPSQLTFLPNRLISDAILLTQELLHNYHLDKSPPRCALNVDLKKAFDTVSWQFIIVGLKAIRIPASMVTWIQICIFSAYFTINMNGELHVFFKSSRGIR